MKIVTTQKYTTSDNRTFEDLKRAQVHELTQFFSASLKEGDRLTAALVIEKLIEDPVKVSEKLAEVTAVGTAEAA